MKILHTLLSTYKLSYAPWRRGIACLLALFLLLQNAGVAWAQSAMVSPQFYSHAYSKSKTNPCEQARKAGLTVRQGANEAYCAKLLLEHHIQQELTKAQDTQGATKARIETALKDMKAALAKKDAAGYQNLTDELNNLIITDLENNVSAHVEKMAASDQKGTIQAFLEDTVYKIMVLNDHIAEGAISDADFSRAVMALSNGIYTPCSGQACYVRGAGILLLATAAQPNIISRHHRKAELGTQLKNRIIGASRKNYGRSKAENFESDKIIAEHLIAALAILKEARGMKTVVQNYADKYGKENRYNPTDPQDRFLVQLTEWVVEYPVSSTGKGNAEYTTAHLLRDWANSNFFLLQVRGRIEMGRYANADKVYGAETMQQVRTYLQTKYCNIGNAYGVNITGGAENTKIAQQDISLGYWGGQRHTDSIRATGDTRCQVIYPTVINQRLVITDLSNKITRELMLFAIPPGFALTAPVKAVKGLIKATKVANKTGKSLRAVYKTEKAVSKAGQTARETKAVQQATRNIESGSSALGKQGARNTVKDIKTAARTATPEGEIVREGNHFVYRGDTPPVAPPPGVSANAGKWEAKAGFRRSGEPPTYTWREYAPTSSGITVPQPLPTGQVENMYGAAAQTQTPAWGGAYNPTNMAGTGGTGAHSVPGPMTQIGNGGTPTARNPIGFNPGSSAQGQVRYRGLNQDFVFPVRAEEQTAIQQIIDRTTADVTTAKMKYAELDQAVRQLRQQKPGLFGKKAHQEALAAKEQALANAQRTMTDAIRTQKNVLAAVKDRKPLSEIRYQYKGYEEVAQTSASSAVTPGIEIVNRTPKQPKIPEAPAAKPTARTSAAENPTQTAELATRLKTQGAEGPFERIVNRVATHLTQARSNPTLTTAQRARVAEAERYFSQLTAAELKDPKTVSSAMFREQAAVLRSPAATEHAFYVEGAGFAKFYKDSPGFLLGKEEGFIPHVVGDPTEGFLGRDLYRAFQKAPRTDKPVLVQITSHGELDGAGKFYIPSKGLDQGAKVDTEQLVNNLQQLRQVTGTPEINLQLDACHAGQFVNEFEKLPQTKRQGINVYAHGGGVGQENELLQYTPYQAQKAHGSGSIAAHQQEVLIDVINHGNVFARGHINGTSFNPLEQAALRAKAEGSPLAQELDLLHQLQDAAPTRTQAIMKQYERINSDTQFHGSYFRASNLSLDRKVINYIKDTAQKMMSGQRWEKTGPLQHLFKRKKQPPVFEL